MPIIAICSLKGGTGKTTSAIYLATALARQGKTVYILDGDSQGSATEWGDQASDAGSPLPFEIHPANAQTINRVKPRPHQWVIIDCPPGDTRIIDAAVAAADYIIIPTSPSYIEADRMWSMVDLTNNKPRTVLLTSVVYNTKTQDQLKESLSKEDIPTFRIGIPQRQEIKKAFGQKPNKLHGYDTILNELVEALES